MTRFMMSLDEAVDLVLYAFDKAEPGDIFIQKAPAATIEVLAQAVLSIFKADNPIKIIGTRHAEKLYETLLTREEMMNAVDLGRYYRIPADNRDLNYDLYFSQGKEQIAHSLDYNSHNTDRLSKEELVELLLSVKEMQDLIAGEL